MSQTLEDRIIQLTINGKKLTAEIRQFFPGDHMIVWVPVLSETLRLEYDKSASTSNAWINAEKDASVVYSHQTWTSSNKFTKIKVNKRTQTS
jgi:hypothetical protein